MKGPSFKFLAHTTDLEFESRGKTLSEAFEGAALAAFSGMTDVSKVSKKRTLRFSIKRRGDEVALLYDFLDKLVFLYDSKRMFFSAFKVRMTPRGLSAEIKGERITAKHPQLSLVKSVTYHEMRVWRRGEGFFCRAILDI